MSFIWIRKRSLSHHIEIVFTDYLTVIDYTLLQQTGVLNSVQVDRVSVRTRPPHRLLWSYPSLQCKYETLERVLCGGRVLLPIGSDGACYVSAVSQKANIRFSSRDSLIRVTFEKIKLQGSKTRVTGRVHARERKLCKRGSAKLARIRQPPRFHPARSLSFLASFRWRPWSTQVELKYYYEESVKNAADAISMIHRIQVSTVGR